MNDKSKTHSCVEQLIVSDLVCVTHITLELCYEAPQTNLISYK